jgi:hypothetical protein
MLSRAQGKRSSGCRERRAALQLMAMFGWLSMQEAERYPRAAERGN